MSDPARAIKEFRPQKPFLICIDSDGCVFDSMETKHKECFCPEFVLHFGLQSVSKYARQAWEFVNLYSKSRGSNRFLAVTRVLDLLARRPEVQARKAIIPRLQGLRDWVERESKLGNPALKTAVEQSADPDLILTYTWSLAVNEAITRILRDVPPFPMFRESLDKMVQKADSIVVSQTPIEALVREWQEHRIDGAVQVIAGQEMGTKSQHIAWAAKDSYAGDHILMIGDAPGDLKAAQANGALFYPVIPGAEDESWQRFHDEALDRFFSGAYSGAYEQELIAEFDRHLPELPPWN